jgi:multidrug efflux pump subunit AcrA (membrane-fusion protein)
LKRTHPLSEDHPSATDGRPLEQLTAELARLLETCSSSDHFFAEFLPRVLTATQGVAGAVWKRTAAATFEVEYQINLAEVGLDQDPLGPGCHAELLLLAAEKGRPAWVPARGGPDAVPGKVAPANRTAYGELLAPILINKECVGVLTVWQEPAAAAEPRKNQARLLTELAGFAAAYLHKAHWQHLQGREQARAQLEAFALQIHESLNPKEVACLVANHARLLLGCDQVAVALNTRETQVEAISGATLVEKKSCLIQAMQALCAAVAAWGERLVYRGSRDDSLPPDVVKTLDAYLTESAGKLLIVQPLADPREEARPRPRRSVLLVECFGSAFDANEIESGLEGIARHAASALYNAVEFRRASSGWLRRGQQRLREWVHGKRPRKALVIGVALMLFVSTMVFVPAAFNVSARGQLVPKERQIIFAHLHGKIVETKTHHGDRVKKDEELLFIENLESGLKVEQLNLRINFAEQRLAALNEQLGQAASPDERNPLIKERINQEYELRKAVAERGILLQGGLNPRKAPVLAPLAGKVVTFDTREQLLGKAVKPGDPLLRIARVDGPWEIEIFLPEGQIAPVREGLQRAPKNQLEVELLVSSLPLQSFHGRLRQEGLGGETIVKDNAVVLPVKIEIADPELAGQLGTMPVSVEVRARIRCGRRSLGYVWFSDLLEFFYERIWF